MSYSTEKEMYPDVINWLDIYLKQRFTKQKVIVRDCSTRPLKRVIQDEGLSPKNKPEWLTFDIRVDVCGFIIDGSNVDFAFIECKNKSITLLDVSQLLGYSKVALPVFSCIVSPFGMSSDVSTLLVTHNRQDVLDYEYPRGKQTRCIYVATWLKVRQSIDYSNIVPAGKMRI